MKLFRLAAAAALAALFAGTAFGQAKEIRIAHVYDKTGPLEAYAKQSHTGLMMGLAGIGYGLLRLAAPERVRPVLTLALP